jgi:DNA-binding beta-propeller fold protein YncE
MKKLLLSLFAVAILIGITTLTYVPLSVPNEICEPATQWDGNNSGWRLNHPMGLAWSNGFLWVADGENASVKKLTPEGGLVAEWKDFKRPVAVAAAKDAVYIADFLADRIVKLDPEDGVVVATWGRHGNSLGEFDAPSGIAVDPQGFVYVTDFYNHRVQKLTGEGRLITQWGTEGRWNGQLHYPTDVAVGPAGEIFVADAYNHRVEVFAADGAYLRKWGGVGYGLSGKWGGWFRLAKALALDAAGNVYVADAFNHRVQIFSTTGRLLGTWDGRNAQHVLKYPAGIAVGADRAVYVSDFFENRIWKLHCE